MTANEAQKKEILSKREVAKLLDISTRTVSRLTEKGVLTAYTLNNNLKYYKYSEILNRIEQNGKIAA